MHGMVTSLFQKIDRPSKKTFAVIGGPPIMYKFTIMELENLNFRPERVYMTLERRMRCGVGQCGHCIVGTGKSIKYVCKDGPVFTLWDAMNTKGMI
jgi:sulfhydrogenase subunit gamma (sulfur reductase)